MDFLSAAYQVLKDAGQPLRYEEISDRALARGLIAPSGKTPQATMGARLYTDVKKENSRFDHVDRATFGLRRKARIDDIGLRVQMINDETRSTIKKRLHDMPADRFEALIGELLVQVGFEETSVVVTSYANDGGIDVRGVLNAGNVTAITAAVQVKRWKRNVQTRTVRDVRGSLTTHEQGIIITTSDFSSGARAEAKAVGKAPISLINGDALIELLIKHDVGVTKERHEVFFLDSEWWDEISGLEDPPAVPAPVAEPVAVAAPRPAQFPLPLRATNNPELKAEMLDDHGRVLFNGTIYRSPSGAGKEAGGWKSCNGWTFWQYQDPHTLEWRLIDDLRGAQ
jgi:restriction system protein